MTDDIVARLRMDAEPTEGDKADLRLIADVDIPEGAEVFCVPVPDGWGL